MNLIDVFLIIIILLSVWSGYQKGFIVQTFDLVTWLGSLLAGLFFYKYIAVIIEKLFPSLGVWIVPVSFIITIIIARVIISLIVTYLLRATPKTVHHHGVNKILGIIPGTINGVVWATIISALLLALPLSDGLSERTRESRIADRLADHVEWIDEKLSPVFDEAINKTINKLTVNPGSHKSVKLSYTVPNPKVREDLEAKMLVLINEERKKQELNPLTADPELTIVARNHSRDMFARGYFSHVTPEGKSPFDRINNAGVKFLTAGENLALAQTLSLAHKGLMNSPGHRANILEPKFGRVGIGILDGGVYGFMVTQNFRN
jgi:uncharacterized protein YkwD